MNNTKDEVRRILAAIHTLLRMLDISNREVERRMGLAPSTLTRFFNGQVEAKLETVLGIARAVGFEYNELFDFLYPERPEPDTLSASARKVRSMLEGLQPRMRAAVMSEPPAAGGRKKGSAGPVDPEELEKAVRRILEDLGPEAKAREAKPKKAGKAGE
jgi:transcriptional regulator with XRE-family HTH domain